MVEAISSATSAAAFSGKRAGMETGEGANAGGIGGMGSCEGDGQASTYMDTDGASSYVFDNVAKKKDKKEKKEKKDKKEKKERKRLLEEAAYLQGLHMDTDGAAGAEEEDDNDGAVPFIDIINPSPRIAHVDSSMQFPGSGSGSGSGGGGMAPAGLERKPSMTLKLSTSSSSLSLSSSSSTLEQNNLLGGGSGRGGTAAQVDAGVYLAAPQCPGEHLPGIAFEAAEVFRQPQRQLEVAVIDRAQLAGERTPGTLALPSGEAGHAADHVCSPRGSVLKSRGPDRRATYAAIARVL